MKFDIQELQKKKLLTREEAAFYIGISLPTLQQLTNSDDFKATVRIGKQRVFINREILDKWLDEQAGKKRE